MPEAAIQEPKAAIRKRDLPPGPRGYPIIGVMPEIRRDWLGFLEQCARDYGDIVYFRFFNIPICYVNHPGAIESVLITDYANFIKSKDYQSLRGVLGNGLLTSEGEFWRRQRRLAQPGFHRDRIAGYASTMVAAAERMLGSWQDGETRDVHQEMMKVTLEIAARTLFHAEVAGSARDVGEALEVVMDQYLARVDLAFLIPESWPTPGNLRFRKAVERLDRIIYGIIRERRAAADAGDDLLAMLLAARDDDGQGMTDRQLRDEVMTLLLAGHETTANNLSWTWYLLAQYPDVEARLLAELDAVLGGRHPLVGDLRRLVYTNKVIQESLRLYPPAWGIGREALHDFELGGYRLPAGTNVFMSQWLMHHDARYYDEPQRFRPERWTEEFENRLPRFAYFPFGGGPRVCVGAAFAKMEAVLLLATIAPRFHLSLMSDRPPPLLPSITLRPKEGIKVVLHRRRSPSDPN